MKQFIKNIMISIKFPRNLEIRRMANDIEDSFKGKYLQPMVIPIPDEVEPLFPRVTLNSINGHSQINFSQISIDFVVNFDDNYSDKYELCEKYIMDRVESLISFLEKSKINTISYVGMTTKLKYEFQNGENVKQYIIENFMKDSKSVEELSDYNQKITLIKDNEYYHNITLGNYRDYDMQTSNGDIPSLTSFEESKVVNEGIFVDLDVNSRYAYSINGKKYELCDLPESFGYLYSKNKEWINIELSRMFTLESEV